MNYGLRILVVLCCFMVATVFMATGCSKQDEDKQKAVQKKPAATKRIRASAKPRRNARKAAKKEKIGERERYEAYLRVKKNDIDERMAAMEKGMRRATGRTKARLEREMRELRHKKDEVDAAYLKYNRSKDTNWQSARSDMDRSIQSFDEDAVPVTAEEM